ncbi:hypothetical protein ES708_23839 [subsurface metagenome]
MNQFLIRKIDPWSVARTVFPLAWIVSAVTIFLVYLLAGGILARVIKEVADTPVSLDGTGVFMGFFLSIILGFFSTIATTISSVIMVAAYNFLASLGGGFVVHLADSTRTIDKEEE